MSDVFEQLREAAELLAQTVERASSDDPAILKERTERVARTIEDNKTKGTDRHFLVFRRSGRRYGAALEGLGGVQALGPVTHLPIPHSAYLGLTSLRGKILPAIDLPRMFSESTGLTDPRWVVQVEKAGLCCGVVADEIHDVIPVDIEDVGPIMPMLPAPIQRAGIGVMTDGTLLIDLAELLADPGLIVDERS